MSEPFSFQQSILAVGRGSPGFSSLWPSVGWALVLWCGLCGLSSTSLGQQRISELQLLGTHNSYRLAPDPVAMNFLRTVVPAEAQKLAYSHRSLTDQLETLQLRHFELDLFRDPKGGLFGSPLAYRMAVEQGIPVPPFDPENKLVQPGIKVLHAPDFDFRTTVYTFRDALEEIKSWSDRNRQHIPVFLLLELKSQAYFPSTRPLAWDQSGFEELEKEILSVFPADRILKPDDIRGSAATLRESVIGQGWPPLEQHRGKLVFLMDNQGALANLYLRPSPTLEGRLLFVSVAVDHPAAAFMKRNDPVQAFDEIQKLVAAGFLVRTRADADTFEARHNDTRRRDQALRSGAQLISTDYPQPDPNLSDYFVPIPGRIPESR